MTFSMSDDEIRVSYNTAKDQKDQFKVLADLNVTTPAAMAAKLRDLGDGLAERYREGWDEHREGIQERRDEFREEFQERLEEHREGRRAFRTELKQKGEALWQKLDRYL